MTASRVWLLALGGASIQLAVTATAGWLSLTLFACNVHLPVHPAGLPCASPYWAHPPLLWTATALTLTTAVALGVRLAGGAHRQWWATRRLLRTLFAHRKPRTDQLQRAADQAGVTAPLVEVEAPEPVACCYGLVRSRILVTSGLTRLLDQQQLAAVLAHEQHHARRCDPTRIATLRLLGRFAILFPALRELTDHHAVLTELAADQYAVTQVGRRPTLGAIHAVLSYPHHTVAIYNIARFDALTARIDHLLDQHQPALHIPAH
ncbi:MAG: M56 family metallopeptidase, partial [Gemmatimonadales bacterium]